MLKKFTVSNYRQFNEPLEFDLTAGGYTFNTECVQNDLVKLALIYGENGTGKSNLGWALFDLVSHLTDYKVNLGSKQNFLNAVSEEKNANFKFEFEFFLRPNKSKSVIYEYRKDDRLNIIYEKLIVDGEIVIEYNVGQIFEVNLDGAEYLNKNINPSQNLSAIKYVYNNTSFDKRKPIHSLYVKFMEFVHHILYFRSVFQSNIYAGYREGGDNIEQDIIKNNNLKDFEKFLNDFGINFKLVSVRQLNEQIIGIKSGKKVLPFFDVISTGTLSLTFFYYWWQNIRKNNIPLLFIDEFDCSYHFALSEKIVEKLRQLPNTQVILTTHNTNLLSNELIRPDCGFVIDGKKIKSLNKLTVRELRYAHNLERMYQSGEFDDDF